MIGLAIRTGFSVLLKSPIVWIPVAAAALGIWLAVHDAGVRESARHRWEERQALARDEAREAAVSRARATRLAWRESIDSVFEDAALPDFRPVIHTPCPLADADREAIARIAP